MNSRKVLLKKEVRKGFRSGIDKLKNAVVSTLGPKGRNVIYYDKYNGVQVTKDGVTVAERVILEDKLQYMGCELVKQAAKKTNDSAGDGTTTSTLLAHSMIVKGFHILDSKPLSNPTILKKGMYMALEDITKLITKKSVLVNNDLKKIENIATISGNNDPEIGKLFVKAFKEVNNMDYIDIQESKTNATFIDIVKGCQFNKGYLSEFFCTHVETKQVIFSNPNIIVYEGVPELKNLLSHINNASISEPLVVMVKDISDSTLNYIVGYNLKAKLPICIVKTPGFGLNKKDKLLDICATLGATYVSGDNKMSIIEKKHYGSAEKVIIDSKNTMFVNGKGSKERVLKRVSELQAKLDNASFTGDRDYLKNRIARLTSGVGIINVGASTPVELTQKKARYVDALEAVKSAISEGILPGGGTSLLKIQKILMNSSSFSKLEEGDLKEGYRIVLNSLSYCLKTILENGGYQDSEISSIINQVSDSTTFNYGYNVISEKFGNMFKFGVIDPSKVTRVALENAVSVASMMLVTDCALVDSSDVSSDLPLFLQDQ